MYRTFYFVLIGLTVAVFNSRRKTLEALAASERQLSKAQGNLETAIAESGAVITHDALPTIVAEPTQCLQLFQNLLGNAIKFRGSRAPVIHVSPEREPGGWKFGVRDNGIGIEEKYFDRLFKLFQRLHTRDEYPGTGLGLSICEKIVKGYGARIWVESVAGQGATFFISLPESPPADGSERSA